MSAGVAGADWRDPSAYEALLDCRRSGFAWEWLRRRCDYRAVWRSQSAVASFGLVRPEPPDFPVPKARPIWSRSADPSVLRGFARPGQAFTLVPLAAYATSFSPLRHSRRFPAIQPVDIEWRLNGVATALPAALALQRLISLTAHQQFVSRQFPPEARASRWAAALRAHDALAAGASLRDIAVVLYNLKSGGYRWRTETPDARSRVGRLAKLARESLLRSPSWWLAPGS